jgi:hypothetical protein
MGERKKRSEFHGNSLRKHHRVDCVCGIQHHMHTQARKVCGDCGLDLRSLPYVVEDTDKVIRLMIQESEPNDWYI